MTGKYIEKLLKKIENGETSLHENEMLEGRRHGQFERILQFVKDAGEEDAPDVPAEDHAKMKDLFYKIIKDRDHYTDPKKAQTATVLGAKIDHYKDLVARRQPTAESYKARENLTDEVVQRHGDYMQGLRNLNLLHNSFTGYNSRKHGSKTLHIMRTLASLHDQEYHPFGAPVTESYDPVSKSITVTAVDRIPRRLAVDSHYPPEQNDNEEIFNGKLPVPESVMQKIADPQLAALFEKRYGPRWAEIVKHSWAVIPELQPNNRYPNNEYDNPSYNPNDPDGDGDYDYQSMRPMEAYVAAVFAGDIGQQTVLNEHMSSGAYKFGVQVRKEFGKQIFNQWYKAVYEDFDHIAGMKLIYSHANILCEGGFKDFVGEQLNEILDPFTMTAAAGGLAALSGGLFLGQKASVNNEIKGRTNQLVDQMRRGNSENLDPYGKGPLLHTDRYLAAVQGNSPYRGDNTRPIGVNENPALNYATPTAAHRLFQPSKIKPQIEAIALNAAHRQSMETGSQYIIDAARQFLEHRAKIGLDSTTSGKSPVEKGQDYAAVLNVSKGLELMHKGMISLNPDHKTALSLLRYMVDATADHIDRTSDAWSRVVQLARENEQADMAKTARKSKEPQSPQAMSKGQAVRVGRAVEPSKPIAASNDSDWETETQARISAMSTRAAEIRRRMSAEDDNVVQLPSSRNVPASPPQTAATWESEYGWTANHENMLSQIVKNKNEALEKGGSFTLSDSAQQNLYNYALSIGKVKISKKPSATARAGTHSIVKNLPRNRKLPSDVGVAPRIPMTESTNYSKLLESFKK